jgi:hypothetical protein
MVENFAIFMLGIIAMGLVLLIDYAHKHNWKGW